MFKNYIQGKKAVFFDLDGTLVDTEPIWNEALLTVLGPLGYGFVPIEKLPPGTYIGTKWEFILGEYDIETPLSTKDLVDQTHNELIKIIRRQENFEARDGFWDLIVELKDEKHMITALLSNSDRVVVDAILNKLEMKSLFDLTIAGDEVKQRKPDPEIYKKAAKNLNLSNKEVLVFEDSVTGAQAAAKAKMDMVIIWQQEVSHKRYPGNILGFIPNFENIAGNLDMTYEEKFDKEAPEFIKEVEEEEKNLPKDLKLYTQ